MGCGEQGSVDESPAVTVVQCDPGFRKRTIPIGASRNPGSKPGGRLFQQSCAG